MDRKTIIETLRRDVAGQCVAYKMREATRKLSRRYDEALKPVGIKGTQFSMLNVITLLEGMTLSELAEKMGLERTTLLRNLQPLERRGFIKLSEEGFRRARTAEITDQGLAILEKAIPLWQGAQASLKAEIGAQAWSDISSSIDQFKDL